MRHLGAFARWSLPLMQAKRNFRSLKSLILRRRPAIPWFHCRQCFVSGFVFSRFFNFSYALSLSLRLFISFFSISLPFCAGALFGGGGSCRRQGKSAAPWRGEAMFGEGELPLAVLLCFSFS